ncbi:phytanoyl-CoA dioxygenase family protein [Ramlibacter sp. XY19]|uniref:phytanoyl-CoA dioxygenase family protein n=1 Tax=Ramlibacter paludis TaxID=2908000 RepID=UPI0023DB23B0|nr:phytanoyl-CoA dioxygenase family protein [Ramlibacter paludis]MCG2592609.1 phytanoyl-CoA dioxygenase family protein [Ramlibacter paludis]
MSDAQVATFRQDGIVVLESGLADEVLDGITADLERLPQQLLADYREGRVQDAWRAAPNVQAAATFDPILEVLAQLYGATPRPFQTLNFPRGTQQRAHSDSIHFNSEPFGMMCGVWLALEDIGPDQGPLVYYPGSQDLPEMNFEDMGLPPDYAHYRAYEDYIEATIARHGFAPRYGLLKKGQMIVWSANVLHGGAAQRDMSLSRLSQVTHYFFEGCRYWRPGLSKDGRAYFEPQWIPAAVAADSCIA